MNAIAVKPLRLAVLISGRGSNMLSIARDCLAHRLAAEVVLVLADTPMAEGLAAATALGLTAKSVDPSAYRREGRLDKDALESALAAYIDASKPDLIVLAGFMRVLSATFVARYAGRIVNIHPSLLPRHKGLHTHERVLAAGDTEHGVSVHYVTAELDGGPVILQAHVPVLPGDDAQSLAARVQRQEHIIYPRVIGWIAQGRLQCVDGTLWMDGTVLAEPLQLRADGP